MTNQLLDNTKGRLQLMTWIPVSVSYCCVTNHYTELRIPFCLTLLLGISFIISGTQNPLFPVLLAREIGFSWSLPHFISVVMLCATGAALGAILRGKREKTTAILPILCTTSVLFPISSDQRDKFSTRVQLSTSLYYSSEAL